MKLYQTESHFFMVFLTIAVMFFLAIPAVFSMFAQSKSKYVISELKRAQAEMFFYEIDNGDYKRACISGFLGFSQSKLVLETGNGVSCVVSDDFRSLSMYTRLNKGDYFCVDSTGFSGITKNISFKKGYCSK